jgi:hypothetical protein
MKIIGFVLLLASVLAGSLEAQLATQTIALNTNTTAAATAPTVISRSANQRIWARIVSQTNADGSVTLSTNRAYVELATGLCRFSAESNAWVDADPTIALLANGAAATGTEHQVTFSADAADAGWAVHLTDCNGSNFVSSVYGLAYFDYTTGSKIEPRKPTIAHGVPRKFEGA